MSHSSIEKAEIVHEESIAIAMPREEVKVSKYAPPPVTELEAFQKQMIGTTVGFAGFALSSFMMGIFNAGILTSVPQVMIGVAITYGGMGQIAASIIEICHKHHFSAASFFSFGAFYVGFGILFIPGTGFLEAAVAAGQLEQCMGLLSIAYSITAFIFLLGTLKQPILVRVTLSLTFLSFFFSALGAFTGVVALTKAGGWFSFGIGVVAWYCLAALLYNENNTYIKLPFF